MSRKEKNKNSTDRQEPKRNPYIGNIIKFLFEVLKHVMSEKDLVCSGKKTEEVNKHFESLNNMLTQLQTKSDEMRMEIEKLKYRILIGNILFIVVLATLLAQIFLMR